MEFLQFGFAGAFCFVMFVKGCKVLDKLSGAINRLELTQSLLCERLHEKKNIEINS